MQIEGNGFERMGGVNFQIQWMNEYPGFVKTALNVLVWT